MARIPSADEQVVRGELVLKVKKVGLSTEQFIQLCHENPDLRMELTAQKELIIMPPPGPKTSWRNVIICTDLTNWARKDRTGLTFDSQCLYVLPNGAHRSPDASWLRRERWEGMSLEDQEKAAHLCPDFVLELMSPSDRLGAAKAKMSEYIANGAHLGWLIDPFKRRVYIYRPGESAVCLISPTIISGDPVLPGFLFNVAEIW